MNPASGLSIVGTESLRAIGSAMIVALAAVALGELASRAVRPLFRTSGDDASFAERLAAGLAVLGTLTGIIAWAGIAMVPLTVIVTVVAAAAGVVSLVRQRQQFAPPRIGWPLLLLLPPVGVALALAIAPVNSPDELIYKLAVPHAYLLSGRMLPMPLSSHSYLALSYELASIPALVLGGGVAAKLAHFAIYLAALRIIHSAVGRRRREAALPAVIVVAWTPALGVVAGWAWSDWGVVALVVMALDRYDRWEHGRSTNDLALAAVAAGCAASVKYTALPFVAALAAVAFWNLRRERALFLKFAAIVALFGSFFYLRNVTWSGSPVAPMLLPGAPPLSHYRSAGLLDAWTDFLRGRYLFDAAMIDEAAGVLLPLVSLTGVVAILLRRPAGGWRWIVLSQLPVVISMAPVTRNLMPAFVPLALAGTGEAVTWLQTKSRGIKAVAGAMVTAVLLWQGTIVARVVDSYDLGGYLTGRQDAVAYIGSTRAFAAPYGWIARHTPPDARLLLLGENRTFYLPRPFVAASNFDGPRIAAWLAKFPDGKALAAELSRQRITHIAIHLPWYTVGHRPLGVVERESVLEVSPAAHRSLMEFLSTRCTLRYRDREYVIYEIRRSPPVQAQVSR